MTGFLIVYTDYEGLKVISLHNKDLVKEAFLKLQDNNKKVHDLFKKYVQDEFGDWYMKGSEFRQKCEEMNLNYREYYCEAERYCILQVDENGAKCVCQEFGVAPEKTVYY